MKPWAVAILGMLALVRGALPAAADGLDCNRPSLPLARLVCGDPLLRAADEEESAVYDAALLASLDRSSLRDDERAWFAAEILPYNWFAEQHAPIDNATVRETYRRRSEALRRQTQLWRKLRRAVPGTTLAASCLALPMYPRSDGCAVTAFEPVAGEPSLRDQQQIYQQQPAHRAVIVFAAVPDRADEWRPIAVAYREAAKLDAPRLLSSPNGRLLLIHGLSASDGEDASALYRFDAGELQDIDGKSWLDTLSARLPDGLQLSHPIVPDYAKMQAVATVTRSESSCCPAGDQATMDLAIEEDRVVVKGVAFDGPSGPQRPNGN